VTLGYGRDITFFKNTSFLCRIELDASYILGRALVDKDDELFSRETPFTAALNIGFYLF
jgi:hypothetical protein